MLRSMTGFGRCEIAGVDRKITVEMKSVNHRYCDISIKLPKKLGFFETSIRSYLKKAINRGKIDVFITYEDYSENNVCVKYNEDLAREYYENLKKMSESFNIDLNIRVSELSRYPDVFSLEEQTIDEKELWDFIEKAISGATEHFIETRIKEGENLKLDIAGKLDNMLTMIDYIEERSPEILKEYREKLMTKVNEILADTKIDESIVATEVTVFADKICVDEETVRLRSHIKNMKDTLDDEDSVGRKLDFIAQEMNREANTILSKANDLAISNIAIDLKTEIEKVREQIQNIE
ncbi:MAG TPA: YicC family protein [Clostridiales bacterium]|nr:YicC family protein [Clostridiales bacterium]